MQASSNVSNEGLLHENSYLLPGRGLNRYAYVFHFTGSPTVGEQSRYDNAGQRQIQPLTHDNQGSHHGHLTSGMYRCMQAWSDTELNESQDMTLQPINLNSPHPRDTQRPAAQQSWPQWTKAASAAQPAAHSCSDLQVTIQGFVGV